MTYPLDDFSKIYYQGAVMPSIIRVASETPMLKVTRFSSGAPLIQFMDVLDSRRLVLQSNVCASDNAPAPTPGSSASTTLALNTVLTGASVLLGMHLTGSSPMAAAGLLTGLAGFLPTTMAQQDICEDYMEIEIYGPMPTNDEAILLLQAELKTMEDIIADLEAQLAGTVETTTTPVCAAGLSAESDIVLPDSIFDSPTADEMAKIATKLSTFDFTGEGDALTVLNPAPLAGPNGAAISELFGSQSLATTDLPVPLPFGEVSRRPTLLASTCSIQLRLQRLPTSLGTAPSLSVMRRQMSISGPLPPPSLLNTRSDLWTSLPRT
jgi:hypothetical protein